jgi:hypothetical protein
MQALQQVNDMELIQNLLHNISTFKPQASCPAPPALGSTLGASTAAQHSTTQHSTAQSSTIQTINAPVGTPENQSSASGLPN